MSSKDELRKQLFPSSSPNNSRDGDIVEQFRRPQHPSSLFLKPFGTANSGLSSNPSRSRPINSVPAPNRADKFVQSQRFATIVSNSNTFKRCPGGHRPAGR